MKTYWISFRLADNNTYKTRYEHLMETINSSAENWWIEPSSFIVFVSKLSIDEIAGIVRDAVDVRVDLVIIGMTDFKAARIVGVNEDPDIFKFIPFLKKA